VATSHQTVKLRPGAHETPEDGVCVMELASLLADEPFSDSPASVCPAVREFLQGYNDWLPDPLRQDLYALASDVVGTRGPARMTAWRARLCIGWGNSQARLERVSTGFGRWTLANCALAGSYSARAAQRNRWCHEQTLAFFTWLAHARSSRPAFPRIGDGSSPHRVASLLDACERNRARDRAAVQRGPMDRAAAGALVVTSHG
jgi:hypothetical protein